MSQQMQDWQGSKAKAKPLKQWDKHKPALQNGRVSATVNAYTWISRLAQGETKSTNEWGNASSPALPDRIKEENMTLPEAIERLREDIQHPTAKFMPDLLKAEQLGIEALERLRDLRKHEPQTLSTTWKRIFSKLPSETEENV